MKKITSKVVFINVTEDMTPQRIDNYLFSKYKKIPKDMVYKILRKGRIRINKKRILPSYKLKKGDIIRIPPIQTNDIKTYPKIINNHEIIKLSNQILFEDDYLIIINKPSGIAVHGGSGVSNGVIEKFRLLRPDSKKLELVHRIDKETSGILIISKKHFALKELHQQLREKKIKKKYITFVHGQWPYNTKIIKVPLLKKKGISTMNKNQVYVNNSGKISETYFKIIKNYPKTTLISAFPKTGRTHQIRVHALHAGHPIVFDHRYGSSQLDLEINKNNHLSKRLLLHAQSITFIHPYSKKKMYIEAPLDHTFKQCFDLFN
ncbi:Ribosomal large subunit pseudouridine synthase C [Buchnera aphidicola (Eriosoma grossulariae)]|uniref:23S rRNA pseudouridine(955/2504/2580) synthase RluC n=1 Tax=Buchnera aphidicola TaxID=9 RepID=UPI0034641E85